MTLVTEENPVEPQSLTPKIEVANATDSYGRFVMEPLEQGFGMTLGNALRRVLLNALPGVAITAVQIEGVQHEYSMLPHVREDMIDFLLNVKAIRLRSLTGRPGILRLEVSGRAGPVTAGDIEPSSDFAVVNPEQPILHLDNADAKISIEFHVEAGVGYKLAEIREEQVIGLLPVDAIFSPIRRANFEVEATRVGQVTDYDRLILEVWTDKTLTPQDAVQNAARIAIEHLDPFARLLEKPSAVTDQRGISLAVPEKLAAMPVEGLKLTSRTQNSLRRGNLALVGQVLDRTVEELLALRNFGDRSLSELVEKLRESGVPVPERSEDRGWEKAPLAKLFLTETEGLEEEQATETEAEPEPQLAVYSAGGDGDADEEEGEVDLSAFSRRSFAPDDDDEDED